MPVIRVDTQLIRDWASFHAYFKQLLGFPDFYGANMDAWVDCLSSLDSPDHGMTRVHVQPPEVLVLHLGDAAALKSRCPEILDALIECTAFVNHRRIELGEPAVLALSFDA